MLLKKIKIQIPTAERLIGFSTIGIACGTFSTYFFGQDIFVGTLCTSLVLLVNIKFWIIIVNRLITIVAQNALELEVIQIKEGRKVQQENSEIREMKEQNLLDKEEYKNDHLVLETDLYKNKSDYVPNTGGVYVFFFLKLSFLIVLLTLCAFVFSPLCIIFSNTIIVFSLLSSSIRVIWKA